MYFINCILYNIFSCQPIKYKSNIYIIAVQKANEYFGFEFFKYTLKNSFEKTFLYGVVIIPFILTFILIITLMI